MTSQDSHLNDMLQNFKMGDSGKMPKIARISTVSEFGPGKDRDLKLLECASFIMSNISTRNRVILRDWVIGVSHWYEMTHNELLKKCYEMPPRQTFNCPDFTGRLRARSKVQ